MVLGHQQAQWWLNRSRMSLSSHCQSIFYFNQSSCVTRFCQTLSVAKRVKFSLYPTTVCWKDYWNHSYLGILQPLPQWHFLHCQDILKYIEKDLWFIFQYWAVNPVKWNKTLYILKLLSFIFYTKTYHCTGIIETCLAKNFARSE